MNENREAVICTATGIADATGEVPARAGGQALF